MKRRTLLYAGIGAAAAASYPVWQYYSGKQSSLASIDAASILGGEVTLDVFVLAALAKSIKGYLFFSGSEEYEIARRVRNRTIDKYPALVAQCASAADVIEVVNFANHYQLLTAMKCGGHNIAGNGTCEGGLLIDLSLIQGVAVNPERRIASVLGGSLLAELDEKSQAHGLVTTAGTVSHTGVGGLALGGGFGRLARRFGLTSDNLLAADIVTSDGQLRRASVDENPDLYWALRGGGGNFGVVTSFDFQLHPMGRQVIGGQIYYPYEKAKEVISFYAEYCQDMPDDLYVDLVIFAPPFGLKSALYIDVCYSGPPQKAARVLEPLRRFVKPLKDEIRQIDYVELQKSSDDSDPRGTGQHLKSGFVKTISTELVDTLIENLESNMLRGSMAFFQQAGGAIREIPTLATAFPHREISHNLTIGAVWPSGLDPEPHAVWADSYWEKVKGFTDGFYTNDAYGVDPAQAQTNYLTNLDRLVDVKSKYDPANLFRINTNIKPRPLA